MNMRCTRARMEDPKLDVIPHITVVYVGGVVGVVGLRGPGPRQGCPTLGGNAELLLQQVPVDFRLCRRVFLWWTAYHLVLGVRRNVDDHGGVAHSPRGQEELFEFELYGVSLCRVSSTVVDPHRADL